jgi:hypothetical protein
VESDTIAGGQTVMRHQLAGPAPRRPRTEHRSVQTSPRRAAAVGTVVLWAAMTAIDARQRDARGAWMGVLDEHPAIEYAVRPTSDAVAALNERLSAGTATLAFDPASGYLRALLDALEVPAASQMLVLSRTGVQRAFTSPGNPRALYYNESVSVGYIRHAPFLEVIAHDPRQGAVFYTLDQRPAARPSLSRQTSCLSCHVATATLDVPGFMTRSLTARADGTPSLRFGSQVAVDHRTPFGSRWGGWFVTGSHGRSTHLGNTVVDSTEARRSLVAAGPLNVRALDGTVDLQGYPGAGSDVVALAVFDHQTRALNLLTRLGWEARAAAHEGRVALETPAVNELVRETVEYLLFAGEAPMPGGLAGSSGFAAWFSARGPKDAKGRTLHALDLTTRLMRYPCSYTIASPAFAALPDDVRGAVWQGLARALGGTEAGPAFAHLSAADRRAIVEILRETVPESRRYV